MVEGCFATGWKPNAENSGYPKDNDSNCIQFPDKLFMLIYPSTEILRQLLALRSRKAEARIPPDAKLHY